MISLFYVIFDLIAPGSLPWNQVCIQNKDIKNEVLYLLKKHTDYEDYYLSFSDTLLQQWIQKYKTYSFTNQLND